MTASTEEEESSEPDSSDDKTCGTWCKTGKKNPSNERFLGTTVLNIVTNNPESAVEVVSSIIGNDLTKLLTEQSNLYNSQKCLKMESLAQNTEMLQYHTWRNEKVLGTNNFDGTSQKGMRVLLHCPPQFPHPFFLKWVGTILNPFGRPGILTTTASKHRIQCGYSKFGPRMNIS